MAAADAASYRVLAFEDTYAMVRILGDAGVAYAELEQKWTTKDAVAVIKEFAPDVLLLDHYIPPKTGLVVLEALNAAVADGSVARPRYIIAMSSVQRCNSAMMAAGADAGFIKWDVPLWAGWARRPDRGQPPSE
jgi:response regulator of citrate/malate metabolism